MRLCAICTKRQANLVECIDGKKYLVCTECITVEVEEPHVASLHERVFRFLRMSPGSVLEDVCLALSMRGEHEQNHVSQVLSRMVRSGIARHEGTRADRFYSLASGAALAQPNGRTRKNLAGVRFGKLIAVESEGYKYIRWRCRCDCGGSKTVRATDLIRGKTRSCGCMVGRSFRTPAPPAQEATCPAT